jgi:hypothetical protein
MVIPIRLIWIALYKYALMMEGTWRNQRSKSSSLRIHLLKALTESALLIVFESRFLNNFKQWSATISLAKKLLSWETRIPLQEGLRI